MKKNIIAISFIFMTFLLLLGCATVPRSQPKYVEYASIPEKAAIVNIYSLLGAAFPMRVYENNTFIVELKYTSYYTFYLPPGSYQLIAEKWNMHKKYTSWRADLSVSLSAGKEYFFRLQAGFVKPKMITVDSRKAKRELALCRLAENALPITQQPIPIAAEAPAIGKKDSITSSKPVVSVLDFKVENLSASECTLIIDMLSNAIVKTKKFVVIDRTQRQKLLEEIEFSYSDCTDETCQLEIGKLLSADNIIVGSIGKVGSRFVINIKLLEVETSKTISTASEIYKSLDELVDNCQSIAAILTE